MCVLEPFYRNPFHDRRSRSWKGFQQQGTSTCMTMSIISQLICCWCGKYYISKLEHKKSTFRYLNLLVISFHLSRHTIMIMNHNDDHDHDNDFRLNDSISTNRELTHHFGINSVQIGSLVEYFIRLSISTPLLSQGPYGAPENYENSSFRNPI